MASFEEVLHNQLEELRAHLLQASLAVPGFLNAGLQVQELPE